ncbi:MAG: DUF484 family protein [Pseudomonadota bacterium]
MTQNADPKLSADTEPLAGRLTDADVAAYLEARPDFFLRNSDLLSVLELPARSPAQGVTDFHAYALSAVRQKLELMNSMQDDLTDIIRDNIRSQETIHRAILEAMQAETLEEFLHCILHRWTSILDIEAIAVGLVDPLFESVPSGNLSQQSVAAIDALFGSDGNVHEDTDHAFRNLDEEVALFGPVAALVKSCVFLRMTSDGKTIGILALGWRESDGFGDGRGTETLRFLTDALTALLTQWQTKA